MRHPPHIAPYGRAFSLVELLVVMGIIGLLAGVLLPVLHRSRNVAREKVCASNQRQLGMAMFMYAHDNRGYLPVEPTEHNPHPQLMLSLQRYLCSSATIFYCPQAENMEGYAQSTAYVPIGGSDSVVETPANIAAGNISYVYFSFLANKVSNGTPWRETNAFIPRLLRVEKAVAVDPARPPADARPAERWVMSDFFRKGAPFPHGRRHAQGINVLYLDGRVDFMFGRPQSNFR